MTTSGIITLQAIGSATIASWREEGDLGRNPLMGYWALSMESAQSAEMAKNLETLGRLVTEEGSDNR